jgi:hypothetical protein
MRPQLLQIQKYSHFLGPSCYQSKIRRSSFLAFFVLRNEEKMMKAFFKIKIDIFSFHLVKNTIDFFLCLEYLIAILWLKEALNHDCSQILLWILKHLFSSNWPCRQIVFGNFSWYSRIRLGDENLNREFSSGCLSFS